MHLHNLLQLVEATYCWFQINKTILHKKRCADFQDVIYLYSRVSSWRYEVQAAVHSSVRNPFFTGDVNFFL